jgi:tetratricopeptide (TPR) repeat protein
MRRTGHAVLRLLVRLLGWAMALILGTATVWAAEAGQPGGVCPGGAGEPLPARADLSAAAASLTGFADACRNNAAYLAYHGAILLRLGQFEAAAGLLERALLIDPDLAGAQADYAEALFGLGDIRGARSLADTLLSRADTPPGVRTYLQDWRANLDRVETKDGWQLGGSLTLRVGGESNLNSAPAHSSLDLTLPDGQLATLPLSNRARSGWGTLTEAGFQAGRDIAAGGRLQLLADIRGRQAFEVQETNYQQYEFLAVTTFLAGADKAATSANQFSLGASRLDYGGERLYEAERLGLARLTSLGGCLAGGSVEMEARRYPTATNLDGRFTGLGASLRCPLGDGRISLLGRVGEDRAENPTRPGGNQMRWDVRMAYGRPLWSGRIETEVNFGHQADAQSYSSLLENGAKRQLSRLGLRAEWSVPVSRGFEGLVTLEASRQKSNLSLFDIDNAALWLGLRWLWAK